MSSQIPSSFSHTIIQWALTPVKAGFIWSNIQRMKWQEKIKGWQHTLNNLFYVATLLSSISSWHPPWNMHELCLHCARSPLPLCSGVGGRLIVRLLGREMPTRSFPCFVFTFPTICLSPLSSIINLKLSPNLNLNHLFSVTSLNGWRRAHTSSV